mgnify:FL=1
MFPHITTSTPTKHLVSINGHTRDYVMLTDKDAVLHGEWIQIRGIVAIDCTHADVIPTFAYKLMKGSV